MRGCQSPENGADLRSAGLAPTQVQKGPFLRKKSACGKELEILPPALTFIYLKTHNFMREGEFYDDYNTRHRIAIWFGML
ncbi:Uncharacterised protein [Candidatus Burarchaeum australiense]|nr:Uncharacterised protein [Candidatus Burarchaeum australiense]